VFQVVYKHVPKPSVPIATDLNIPEGLPLADPDFRQPGPIDLTLGVKVFSRVITGELLELGPNRPLAQGTRLGYVISIKKPHLIRKSTLFW